MAFLSLDDLKTAWREGLDDDEDAALKIVPIGSGRGKEKP